VAANPLIRAIVEIYCGTRHLTKNIWAIWQTICFYSKQGGREAQNDPFFGCREASERCGNISIEKDLF
jgi:hypothetical protein